jgi:hypothetical protein
LFSAQIHNTNTSQPQSPVPIHTIRKPFHSPPAATWAFLGQPGLFWIDKDAFQPVIDFKFG